MKGAAKHTNDAKNPDGTTARPVRRKLWKRAGAAAVLVSVLVAVCVTGWAFYVAGQRQATIALIERNGGVVLKNWRGTPPPAQRLLIRVLGREGFEALFMEPWKIEFDGRRGRLDDAELREIIRRLRRFQHVEILNISNTEITAAGLEGIGALPVKGGLGLMDCPVGDEAIEHLSGLTESEELWLVGTKISEKGRDHLAKALPNCHIFFDPDGDPTREELDAFFASRDASDR